VVWAEVAIHGSVLEHMVDGGEDRGCDGDDGLLGAAPRSDAVVLGLQVAVLGARRTSACRHGSSSAPEHDL
jgi:hypothetical protein